MRIRKYKTKAYLLSDVAIDDLKDYFKLQAGHLAKENNQEVLTEISYGYSPVIVFQAVKRKDEDDRAGVQNNFHVDLSDGSLLYYHEKKTKEQLGSIVQRSRIPNIEKSDFLIKLSNLTNEGLSMMGYLMEHGTLKFEELDAPSKKAAKELIGRKFAEMHNPKREEGDLAHVVREIMNMERISNVEYVKPTINLPFFSSHAYDLSQRIQVTDVIELDYEKRNIAYTPEKVGFLLGTLFTCQLSDKEIIYLPHMNCKYSWEGGQFIETKYPAAIHGLPPKRYTFPGRLKNVNIGTKGHGLESTPVESVSINFSNVAGMDNLKEEIRSSIIYPLTHPELSEEYGKKAGGGVLFYGPPGCGKTYIVRATVGETGYNFFSASIQDIVGQNADAGAQKLHDIFTEAREGSPAILFFDEIDALGGRRESKQGGAERMIINQFLAEMEGVGEDNRDLLIIGSSNAPWDIDPALRRAGRFTTQIFVPPPDLEARAALFRLHLKERPVSKEVSFSNLAIDTADYSSADITAICEDASKIPWKESLRSGKKREINNSDFELVFKNRDPSLTPWLRLAEREMRKSGEQDVYQDLAKYVFKRAGGVEAAERPDINFTQVAGLENVKESIRNKVIYPLINPELSEEYGRKIGGGILLYGPPGCGKTYISRATAGECGASFYNIKLTDLLSPEAGETEKQLHSIFERASRNAPAILFFDEIDAVAGQRSSSKTGSERRLVNQFLTEMDGFEKNEGVMILAATNTPWDIDPALRRAGRFSEKIFVPAPDLKAREQVFRLNCRGKPISDDVDFKQLADMTEGYSAADISLVCTEAIKIPFSEAMKGGDKRKANHQDFQYVLKNTNDSLTPWFSQAKNEIEESGEKEEYEDLLNALEARKNRVKNNVRIHIPLKTEKTGMKREREKLEKEIKLLKKKFGGGEIDEIVYDDISKDLQRRLVEIEAELGEGMD